MLTEPIVKGIPASREAGHFHRLLQEIHHRAYEKFLERQTRKIPGSEAEDWKSAEKEVLQRAGMFPSVESSEEAPPFPERAMQPPMPLEAWIPEMDGPARSPLSSAELLERLSNTPPLPTREPVPGLADLEVQDVMTRNLVAVGPDCTVRQLVTVLDEHHASAIPVVDAQKKLLGIVSASDLVHLHAKAASMAAGYIRSGQVPVNGGDPELVMGMLTGELLATVRAAEACAPELLSVPPGTKVLEVVAMMASRRLDRVLVVDAGHLVGMLAAPDLLRMLLGDIQQP